MHKNLYEQEVTNFRNKNFKHDLAGIEVCRFKFLNCEIKELIFPADFGHSQVYLRACIHIKITNFNGTKDNSFAI